MFTIKTPIFFKPKNLCSREQFNNDRRPFLRVCQNCRVSPRPNFTGRRFSPRRFRFQQIQVYCSKFLARNLHNQNGQASNCLASNCLGAKLPGVLMPGSQIAWLQMVKIKTPILTFIQYPLKRPFKQNISSFEKLSDENAI